MRSVHEQANGIIRKEAMMSGAANLVINAGINAWMLGGKAPHLVSVDSITSKEHTVLGSSVPMAVILAVILSSMTFFTFRKKAAALKLTAPDRPASPFLWFGFANAVSSGFLMFGIVVSIAVLWQRLFGTVLVSTPVAALITGLIAGGAAWFACQRTARSILRCD